jgi:hypothetical protein
MRHRVVGFLASLALISLLVPSVSAAVTSNTTSDVGPFTFTALCTGETITIEGTIHLVFRLNADGSAGAHENVHLDGTGTPSGGGYAYNGETNQQLHVAADGSFTLDARSQAVLVAKGKAPNERIVITQHLVVDSNGNVVVDDFSVTDDCQGS